MIQPNWQNSKPYSLINQIRKCIFEAKFSTLQFHTESPSVPHQKPFSSTQKPPQFHTKKPSVPHTPQFHTKHPSVPHRLYRAIFCLRGVLNLAEKEWPFCVKLTCGTEGDPNKYGTRTLSCDLKLLKGDS